MEEYLEAIYSFNEQGKQAKNQDLANKLKVSPPSVTQMVIRLSKEGLVEYIPYNGASLTGKGMALAQKVVRKHRLIERFLYDFLKLPENKVHDQACMMEHSLTDETAAALCDALNNPETCPDDHEIPPCPLNVVHCNECENIRASETGEFKLTTQLNYMKPGEEGEVAFIRGGRRATQRIMDMGLIPGTMIKVKSAAPFKGPLEVEVRSTNLALGRKLANHVFVYLVDENQSWKKVHPHGPHHNPIEA